jgi:hypothetical protein
VTIDDFQIAVRLRARRLIAHNPPNAQTRTEDHVTFAREETREGLPAEMQPDERYEDVAVEKRLSGKIVSDRSR